MRECAAFHEAYYAPSNAVPTVCGGFDPDRTAELVQWYFGRIPGRPTAPCPNSASRRRTPSTAVRTRTDTPRCPRSPSATGCPPRAVNCPPTSRTWCCRRC
ncbi:insulinase family protein [Streptomyces sp. NPDC006259]|uniref:insulinase family protein n=1 Tax=Streptomyces sp. NPDC006259 TaxID=3364740 RepID=UPI0036889CDB